MNPASRSANHRAQELREAPEPEPLDQPVRLARARFRVPSLKSLRPMGQREPRRRTRVVRQMQAAECGAAALAMVLDYHGRRVPLAELREPCRVSRDGANAANIVSTARRYGLVARGLRAEPDKLRGLAKPAIVFWDHHHFLVVEAVQERFGRKRVLINDPANGRGVLDWEEFRRGYTGVVLTFEPGPGFERDGSARRAGTGVRGASPGSVGTQALAALTGIVLALVAVAISSLCGSLVDALGAGRSPAAVLSGLVALVLVALPLWQCWRYLLARNESTVSGQHAELLRRLLGMPIEFFGQRRATELARRVTSSRMLADVAARGIVVAVVAAICAVLCAVALLLLDIVLGATAIAVAVAHAGAVHLGRRDDRHVSRKILAAQADLGSTVLNTLNSMETVRATGSQSEVFRRWSGQQARFVDRQQRLGVRRAAWASLPVLVTGVAAAAVLVAGSVRVATGALTPGAVVAALALTPLLARVLALLSEFAVRWPEAEAEAQGFHDVLRHPVARVGEATDSPRPPGDLALREVCFGFGGEPVLRDVSFQVPAGDRVVVVGASGTGKSALAKLAAGLYEPSSGEVTLGGARIGQLGGAATIGFVGEEHFVLDATVRDNVTLWDTSVSGDAVHEALRTAGLDDPVRAWADGLDTWIGAGGRYLSGGQCQRLQLARALVRRPSLLVVDGALDELDAESEESVLDGLRSVGCALLIVGSGLSTRRDAERILVLDASGSIAQVGPHERLVATAGPYAELFLAG
jgi:ABC-type bacteriocin/lantibiotic exporter with double-glycine peptidase domain